MKPRKVITPEQIIKMRELRKQGLLYVDIGLKCDLSCTAVRKHCLDIKVDLSHKRFVQPDIIVRGQDVHTYNFSDLSEKDQQYYLSLKPPSRELSARDYTPGLNNRKDSYNYETC